MEDNWNMIVGYSLVGLLVIAIIIVLLLILISKLSRNGRKKKYNRRDWVKTNPPTYNHQQPCQNIEGDSIGKAETPIVCSPKDIKEDTESAEEHKKDIENEVVKPKVLYFPLSKRNIFLKAYKTNEFKCIFKANFIGGDILEFSLISIEKAKAWDIGEAVLNVGTVLQQDAVDFKCIKKGKIQQKVDKGTTYWKILDKVQVEYLK